MDASPGGANGRHATGLDAYKIPSDPQWEVPRDCVRLGRQIGAGAFGVVFAGSVQCSEAERLLPGLRRQRQANAGATQASPQSRQELTVAVKTLRGIFFIPLMLVESDA